MIIKATIHRILTACKPIKYAVSALLLVLAIAGCKKDTKLVQPIGTDSGSSIKFVLNDNFNFSSVYTGLTFVGLQDTLAKSGPYTFLAPDNNAFSLVGGPSFLGNGYLSYGESRVRNMMLYSIIRSRVSFKSLPLVQNEAFVTDGGGNVYISKYIDGNDTVTTVNGMKISDEDNTASNGLIQVLPQVMNPEQFRTVAEDIHSDTTLTLFAAAMQRANLDVSLLQGNDEYTLLAPSNAAFQQSARLGQNLGISTLDSILMADPVKLAEFLKYHIFKGRYFEGDLYRYANANPDGMITLAGGKVIIGGDPSGFHVITFLGNGDQGISSAIAGPDSYDPTVYNANIPCGNGVVHIINRVLIP